MSLISFYAAILHGLIYALVALGVLISFRILDFPDLTADGSFPLGGAVCAVCLVHGFNPWVATALGMLAGACAGFMTAWLHVSLKILQLLASILVMAGLYSVNLRVMGAPNIPLLGIDTIYTPFINDTNGYWVRPLIVLAVVIAVKFILDWFFATEIGLSVRATGANLRMAQAQGIATGKMILLGMGLSNALIALAGALFVQMVGGADITLGIGTIVIGLAAVIIGETLIPAKRMIWITVAVMIGSLLYKFFIQVALGSDLLHHIGFGPQDLNLVTSLLIVIALTLPKIKHRIYKKRKLVS